MLLVLMRHGIAQELGEVAPVSGEEWPRDQNRALTDLGRRRVEKAARGLKKIGFRAQSVAHSDLVRARQTAELVAATVTPRGTVLEETAALRPEADPAEFVRLLPQWRDCKSLLAVGHLPHLDRLVALLCGSGGRQLTEFGKAATLAIEVPTSGRPVGLLRWYLPPKLLRRLGRP
jgi:phosphohistidine phosphatase